jgi:hypothetical protein
MPRPRPPKSRRPFATASKNGVPPGSGGAGAGREPSGAHGRALRQGTLEATILTGAEGEELAVMRNAAESPLAWLRRRRGPDGAPMLEDASFAAGERFRVDLTRALLLPSVTSNWSAAAGGSARSAGPAEATDAMIAARQRVAAACRAVGADMSGLLIDICGFLKGLEEVERDRRWPPRSGKVVLLLALARLADHYGYTRAIRGPERSQGILAWMAEAG